jgi:hypothetical protein
MTTEKMPDVFWVSEYDTVINFDSEEEANSIAGKGVNTKYLRAEPVETLLKQARDRVSQFKYVIDKDLTDKIDKFLGEN